MSTEKIRYAVVGLGWIVQEAVLPAFKNAQENSELVAFVSGDEEKLKILGDQYNVQARYSYKDYESCLNSGNIDAVFIGLPNNMHCEYTVRAARAGIHVLCEKPMAMKEDECWQMINAAKENKVKLMIAYRLHFEEGNLKALDLAQGGELGEVRVFNSTFSMNVKEGNVRLDEERSGGTLNDIGIYCINAARGIFHAEPEEVLALSTQGKDPRFGEIDEMIGALIRFPDDRLASFICSFGVSEVSNYEIVGTKGSLRVDPAFHHNSEVKLFLKKGKDEQAQVFEARDQFAPELIYFSKCILEGKNIEPSGIEGLADVRIIEAIYQSAEKKKPIRLKKVNKKKRSNLSHSMYRPKAETPELLNAQSPSKKE